MIRRHPAVFILAILLLTTGCQQPPPVSAPTEVWWDSWGVPHFFAPDLRSLCYVFGRSQAEAHGDLLLRLYGQARGRGAEYWGASYLDEDRWVHTMGIPERAERWYEEQTPPFRAALDGFARGINEWAEEHPEALDPEVRRVLPVRATDVLAHLQRVLHFSFVVSREGIAAAAKRELGDLGDRGSNAWAVGPLHTASHSAILLANPHLPWSDRYTFFEAHMVTPTVDLSGVALVGMPFLGIGFNQHLGWTHTVNTLDGADLYSLDLDDKGRYRFDGTWRELEVEQVTLKVREESGEIRRQTFEVKRSLQGPVVAEAGQRALALRVAGLDASQLFAQYWAMAQAENLESFEAAIRRLQMPIFTVMYADSEGFIMHLFGGLVPRRPPGDWDWSGVVPGDTSQTLWSETLGYDELPKAIDPDTGWLQNANDPPWTTTFPPPLDPAAYPDYLAPQFMSLRAQQSARLVGGEEEEEEEEEEERLSFDELVQRKHSTTLLAAERLLDDLEKAIDAHGDQKARAAWQVLKAWDRRADAESRGAVLFEAIFHRLQELDLIYSVPWNRERPIDTPDGLTEPARAAAAVSTVAAEVEKQFGSLDIAWGKVHRLRRGAYDLPASGGPGELGIFRVLGFEAQDDGTQVATRGDSYVAMVEFSKRQRAQAILAYGNSSQPSSPHFGDQLPLFAEGKLRPVWRTRHEIETHLERRDLFGVDPDAAPSLATTSPSQESN